MYWKYFWSILNRFFTNLFCSALEKKILNYSFMLKYYYDMHMMSSWLLDAHSSRPLALEEHIIMKLSQMMGLWRKWEKDHKHRTMWNVVQVNGKWILLTKCTFVLCNFSNHIIHNVLILQDYGCHWKQSSSDMHIIILIFVGGERSWDRLADDCK